MKTAAGEEAEDETGNALSQVWQNFGYLKEKNNFLLILTDMEPLIL